MNFLTIRNTAVAVCLSFGVLAVQDSVAVAQDIAPSHLTAAKEALKASKASEPFDKILLGLSFSLKNRLTASHPDLADKINETVDEEAIKLAVRRGDLEAEAARLYAGAFSEEELNAIAEFYNSEAGQKVLKEGPVIGRELTNSARVWSAGVQRDLEANVQKALQGVLASPAQQEGDEKPADGEKPAEQAKPEDAKPAPNN